MSVMGLPGGQAVFLLVEDDSNDILLVRRAFAKARVLNPLRTVRSGEEAIAYLSGQGKYADRAEYPVPSLILLDLKLPGISGHDLLRWVRAQADFRHLRVVVLSSSEHIWDVDEAYRSGANSFLVKPADFAKFVEMSQALNGFWLWVDKWPPGSQSSNLPTHLNQPEPEPQAEI